MLNRSAQSLAEVWQVRGAKVRRGRDPHKVKSARASTSERAALAAQVKIGVPNICCGGCSTACCTSSTKLGARLDQPGRKVGSHCDPEHVLRVRGPNKVLGAVQAPADQQPKRNENQNRVEHAPACHTARHPPSTGGRPSESVGQMGAVAHHPQG
eukprot:scaffold237428_cov30-Tisochrysis_lutea.AAC.2